jgi:hypothetical protein
VTEDQSSRDPVSCARCGQSAPEPPITWSTSVERGRRLYYCDRCSRENVRAIEGKLEGEWW